MIPTKGYYSLLQFCPDASRLEAVNVGVALFCPEQQFIQARVSSDNRRAERLVGRSQLERKGLDAAKAAIVKRLEVFGSSFESLEDFVKYTQSRGNAIRLTSPRAIRVEDPTGELTRLFEELVETDRQQIRREADKDIFPKLTSAFRDLARQGRATLDCKVKVPVLGRSLSVPFAYQNGHLNLVKPHRFPRAESASIDSAMRLAIEGSLVQRHGVDDGTSAQLIVVSSFAEKSQTDTQHRIRDLFGEYRVESVSGDQVDGFVARVLREAH